MRKLLVLVASTSMLLGSSTASFSEPGEWCGKNYNGSYRSEKECVENEDAAFKRLKSRPISAEVLSPCGDLENGGVSYTEIEACVKEEEDLRRRLSSNPFGVKNSKVWYAKHLQKHFPSHVRVCGFETRKDRFTLLPEDITKFRINSMVSFASPPVLSVEGIISIGSITKPFEVALREESGKREYEVFIEAFLFTPEGRTHDVTTVPVTEWVGEAGGTFRFSFEIGRGYNFAKGSTLLVIASGTPVTAGYPTEPCTVIGARAVEIR